MPPWVPCGCLGGSCGCSSDQGLRVQVAGVDRCPSRAFLRVGPAAGLLFVWVWGLGRAGRCSRWPAGFTRGCSLAGARGTTAGVHTSSSVAWCAHVFSVMPSCPQSRVLVTNLLGHAPHPSQWALASLTRNAGFPPDLLASAESHLSPAEVP